MLGLNGVAAYGLDGEYLHKVAQTHQRADVAEQHADRRDPRGHGMWAFRQFAAFG